MAITFEEITGEVTPEPRGEESRREEGEGEVERGDLGERIRAVLRRERLRADRLSDR